MNALLHCRRAALVAAMVMMMAVMRCEGAWFRIVGPSTITAPRTVGGTYHLVTISNVIIDTGGSLVIDVGAMVATQGKVTLTVQLCSLTVRNGGLLIVKGGTDNSLMTAAGSGPLNFVALNLVVSGGGVAFQGAMPYASIISLGRPLFTMNAAQPSYGAFLSGADDSGVRAGLVFYSAFFNAGSFLLYGQPTLLTDNTFGGSAGGTVGSVLFYGVTTLKAKCMFHLFQLSSTNGRPIFTSGSGGLSIQGGSVFYIEDMESRYCNGYCLDLGSISLSGASFFLLARAQMSGSGTGFRFSGTADSSGANWFGLMGNTFDIGTAVQASYSAQGSSYMSIYGNYCGSSWSQYTSTAYEMCTSVAGTLSSVVSGATGRACTPDTLCTSLAWQCYTPMSSQGCVSQKPSCICASGATTAYCIPFSAPKIPTACISTLSMTLTETEATRTFEETETKTITEAITISPTLTNMGSITRSKTPTTSGPSFSKESTSSPSSSPQASKSQSMSALSITHFLTFSIRLTPSVWTYSRETSLSGSWSTSNSVTRSASPSASFSPAPSLSGSLTASASVAVSGTKVVTPTATRSFSESSSLSACDWLELSVTPIWPLRKSTSNDTMEIAYLDFRDYGAGFMLDDLGQWWVHRFDRAGVSKLVSLFSIDNANAPIIPKITEADFHTTNPVVVGVFLHGFQDNQFYNSELTRETTVGMTFRCSTINRTHYWSVKVLPLPAPISAAAVQTTARSAILASTVLATPYGNAIAALTLNMQQLYLCQPVTDIDQFDITRWKIGDDERATMRGAIVGNVLIVVGQAFVMCVVIPAALWWNMRIGDLTLAEDFKRLLRVLQLPTSLQITVSAVLQLIVAASVSLFRMSSEAGDIALGVFGLLLPLVYVILVTYRAVRIYLIRKGAFNLASLDQPIFRLPREEDEFLFGEYDKPWYAAAETIFLLLIGVICGTPPVEADDCSSQILAVAFISFVSGVMILYYQPMRTTEGQVAALLVRLLTITMCCCNIVMSRSRQNQVRAMQGAAMCLLLLSVLALMRALFDLRRMYEGLPRVIRAVFRLKVPEPEPTPDLIGEPSDELPPPDPVCPSSSSSSEAEFVPREDLRETDVIGFLGHTREEVEDIDELLMAYRGRPSSGGDIGNVDLDRVLRGDFDGSARAHTRYEETETEESDFGGLLS